MRVARLDAATIAGLALPADKDDETWWADDLPRLGYRLRRRRRDGRVRASWIGQYRADDGRSRRSKVGDGTLSPAQAYAQARKLFASVILGGDPQGEKQARRRAATRTFRAIVDSYLEARLNELRASSHRVAKLYLSGPYFKALHGTPVGDVTHADVAACVRAIENKHSANTAAAARRAISTFFAWAIAEGLMGRNSVNPTVGTRKPLHALPRERVLLNPELVAIWNALADGAA